MTSAAFPLFNYFYRFIALSSRAQCQSDGSDDSASSDRPELNSYRICTRGRDESLIDSSPPISRLDCASLDPINWDEACQRTFLGDYVEV